MKKHVLYIVVHDDSHRVEVESVGFGHHAFSESVCDVVGAEETGDHDEELGWDDTEDDGVPCGQDVLLETNIRAFASCEDAPGITGLRSGGFDERVKVAAAFELVLDPKTTLCAEIPRPLSVDFTFQVEGAFLVSDVARCDEEGETDPEEETVDGEEGSVVEEDAGPADEGGEDAETGGDGGDDEFWFVADADDVCVCPDVEPDEETGDETCERVDGEEEV